MLKISPDDLTEKAKTTLAELQQLVNEEISHEAKKDRAGQFWKNRTKNKTFKEIKDKLAACNKVVVEGESIFYCHYYENDRIQDIEHIYPKSAFPERAYRWENYIYICTCCNSKLKNDKYYIFNPKNSANGTNELEGKKGAAPTDDLALINPRAEDPTELLRLSLITGHFVAHPLLDEGNTTDRRKQIKAANTINLLKLNSLSNNRLNAYNRYEKLLRRYVAIKKTTNYKMLNAVLEQYIPKERAVPKEDFNADKQEILRRLQYSIDETVTHPTVWYEMKRQRESRGLEQLDQLLNSYLAR
jgi:uncharacterized protein (TIGR02646 family)